MREQGAIPGQGSSDVCPECVEIDKEIWTLYHEILREKPQHSNLGPAEVLRKLWNAYKALAK